MLTHCNANAKIPNFRPSNKCRPCKVPPGAAALPRPRPLPAVTAKSNSTARTFYAMFSFYLAFVVVLMFASCDICITVNTDRGR